MYAAVSMSKLGSSGLPATLRGRAPAAALDIPGGNPARKVTQCRAPAEAPKNMRASRRRCGARSLRQHVAPMW